MYVKKRPPDGGLFYITKPFYEDPEVNGFHETDTWSRSFKVMSEKVLDFLYRIVYHDTGTKNSPVN